MALVLSGLTTEVEPVSGGRGESAYSYMRAYVAVGRDTHRVRLSDSYLEAAGGELPKVGQDFAGEVSVRAYKDNGGAAALAFTAIRPASIPGV